MVGSDEVSLDGLLVRAGRGDRDAFERLYDDIAPLVYGLARRVVRHPQLAEEVAQDVLVEIWRQSPRFDPGRGRAVAWVATIAHRRAVDCVRSEQARTDRETANAGGRTEATNEPGERIERAEARDEVTDALSVLTPMQREAVCLAFFDGRTHREIAELLDIPLGTAKTRIRDGLIKLRDVVDLPEVLP